MAKNNQVKQGRRNDALFASVVRWIFRLSLVGTACILLLIFFTPISPAPRGDLVFRSQNIELMVNDELTNFNPIYAGQPIIAEAFDLLISFQIEDLVASAPCLGLELSGSFDLSFCVSPDGYYQLRSVQGLIDKGDSFRFFPHVRPASQANEIWIHVDENGRCVIRINREIAWEGAIGQGSHELYLQLQALDLDDPIRVKINEFEFYSSSKNTDSR